MRFLSTCALVASAAGLASANPTALFQTTGVGANSSIGGLTLLSLDRPTKSGTGNFWVMLVRNNTGSATDAQVITGSGLSFQSVARDGTTVFEPGRTFDTADRYMDINSSGDWVAIGNLVGGATTDDEVVYRGNFTGTSLSIPAREGQSFSGQVLGTSNHGPGITDAGAVSFGYSEASTANINYFTNNGAAIVLGQGDVPSGQRGGTSLILNTPFSGRNAFQTTSDGSSYLAGGELSNGDSVLVKDDAVVIQEGNTIFGLETVSQIQGEQNLLQDNGDWYARVRTNTGRGLAITSGTVVAAGGDLVGGDVPGETWSDTAWGAANTATFFMHTGDSVGNYVLGGFTSNADLNANAVWMFNETTEILREGDQMDLDGDGFLDDAFVFVDNSTVSPASLGGFLSDDGWFYTNVEVKNASGAELGDAFIRVAVPAPGALGLIAVAGLGLTRRRRS